MEQASLLFECPVRACKNLVGDPRVPCEECQELFGGFLGEANRPAPPVDEFLAIVEAGEKRLKEVMVGQAMMEVGRDGGVVWIRNQRCWLCEERHTCRLDIDRWGRPFPDNRMICRECIGL